VDRNNPVGLMILSEVALGDMNELKKATVSFKYLGETNVIAHIGFYPCILSIMRFMPCFFVLTGSC